MTTTLISYSELQLDIIQEVSIFVSIEWKKEKEIIEHCIIHYSRINENRMDLE